MVKFVLTLLIITFVVRYVLPSVLRFFVGSFVRKQARKYTEQFGGAPFEAPFGPPPPASNGHQPDGQIHVDFIPPKDKPRKPREFKGGDYVEFEEVK
ncbi:protein of unknown function [Hymenobacter daecheongensis DSM 21074]|uniref:DUF4834 domain-containing protein n=1 Tax=Hymenobacter daecheongensis DSM 21074 TaxID=1121955 RepID=A0A1M6A6Q0_9BACT|nr:DUF4834 family protein [Hymenobacter daecheongensis]SHI32174.1 protein of unknown function [Hymenobacter daecheongensis DSM 21074]